MPLPYIESPATRDRTTLDLLASCIPHIVSLSISASSLHKKADFRVNQRFTPQTQALMIARFSVSYYLLARRLSAVERRHWHGITLLQRATSEDPTVQNLMDIAFLPVNSAALVQQLHSGATLLFQKELTTVGKAYITVKLGYIVFSGIAAAAELIHKGKIWQMSKVIRRARRD